MGGIGTSRKYRGQYARPPAQEAGDVLYVPSGWQHATLNLQESVGIAVEAREPPPSTDGPFNGSQPSHRCSLLRHCS